MRPEAFPGHFSIVVFQQQGGLLSLSAVCHNDGRDSSKLQEETEDKSVCIHNNGYTQPSSVLFVIDPASEKE